jgi:phosphoserine phosphatase
MNAKPIAIFDFDGTFVRSSLLIELVRGLVREGVFPRLAEREIEAAYRAWRERQGTYKDYLMKVVEVFYRRIRGCSVRDVEYVGQMIAEEQRDQVYVFTRGLVQRYRGTHHLAAITGSPDAIAKPFADAWGFARVYASNLVAKGSLYTGDRDPPMDASVDISEFKRGLLRQAMDDLGAVREGSIGVGDTESDIPLLEMVEMPIAFNPNLHLARAARARGWEMVYERKDAIIHLKDDGRYEIENL